MVCIKCNKGEYRTSTIEKEIVINGRKVVIPNVACEKCNECGDIVYTHKQSVELEKKRLSAELKAKPLLTSGQLWLLRRLLNVSLDEICELLKIGKNTYGRWERGEIEITPSMNLLVHSLIDKFPIIRKNLFETEIAQEIDKVKKMHMKESTSLGELLRSMVKLANIAPIVICSRVGINDDTLTKLENNEMSSDHLRVQDAAKLVRFLDISLKEFKHLLDNSQKIRKMTNHVTFYHARTSDYNQEANSISKNRSINKIMEQYCQMESTACKRSLVADEYIRQVEEQLKAMSNKEGKGK